MNVASLFRIPFLFRVPVAALVVGALPVLASMAAPSGTPLPSEGAQARRIIVYSTPSAPPPPAPVEAGRA